VSLLIASRVLLANVNLQPLNAVATNERTPLCPSRAAEPAGVREMRRFRNFLISALKSRFHPDPVFRLPAFVVVTDSNKDSETWECDFDFWVKSKKADSQIFSCRHLKPTFIRAFRRTPKRWKNARSRLWNLSLKSRIF
jgi:hypothetical protein